jgi:hypothetical protein
MSDDANVGKENDKGLESCFFSNLEGKIVKPRQDE